MFTRMRMTSRLRAPTPAMAVALIALFVALSGAAYAAVNLPSNSVGTKQIKNGAVIETKLGSNAVTAAKVKTGSLLAQDFKAGQLPTGRPGPTGPPGPTGAQGPQGPAGRTGTNGANGAAVAIGRVSLDAGVGAPRLAFNQGFPGAVRFYMGAFCVGAPGGYADVPVVLSSYGTGPLFTQTQPSVCNSNEYQIVAFNASSVQTDGGFTIVVP